MLGASKVSRNCFKGSTKTKTFPCRKSESDLIRKNHYNTCSPFEVFGGLFQNFAALVERASTEPPAGRQRGVRKVCAVVELPHGTHLLLYPPPA
eukprot:5779049-Amphidinium_carterae.1